MNGYDFCKKILEHPYGGVAKLLELAGESECEWLELKAGMELLPEEKGKFTPDDLYWEIASAVISLMNTYGGVVIIGIEDKQHSLVPLETNDPRHVIAKEGIEAYFRKEIYERIWSSGKKDWKTKNKWHTEDPLPQLIEIQKYDYQDGYVAAILIRPSVPDCVRVWKDQVEQILCRVSGNVGKVEKIIGGRNMDNYEKHVRQLDVSLPDLEKRYRAFLQESSQKTTEAILEQHIQDYCSRQIAYAQKKMSAVIPLVFKGGELAGEQEMPLLFEPIVSEAINVFDEEDADVNDIAAGSAPPPPQSYARLVFSHERKGKLFQLFEETPRLIITGEPGAGKTTSMLALFLECCKNYSQNRTLTIFIPMAIWSAGGSLEAMLLHLTQLSGDQFHELLKQHRIRLFIDALNECPEQFQQGAIQNIICFLRENPEIPAIISTRNVLTDLRKLMFPVFAIQPLDQEQQKTILHHMLQEDISADDTWNTMMAMPGGKEIAANPLLLSMVADVVNNAADHGIPKGRAQLYRTWLSQWYAREAKKMNRSGQAFPWKKEDALEILSTIAFEGRRHGKRSIPVSMLEELYPEDCSRILQYLCNGILMFVEDDMIHFRHETFQEYLCAEALLSPAHQPPEDEETNPQVYNNFLNPDSFKYDFIPNSWSFVFAYIFELQDPVPDGLWKISWKVDCWLGYFMTDSKRMSLIREHKLAIPKFDAKDPILWNDKLCEVFDINNEDIYTDTNKNDFLIPSSYDNDYSKNKLNDNLFVLPPKNINKSSYQEPSTYNIFLNYNKIKFKNEEFDDSHVSVKIISFLVLYIYQGGKLLERLKGKKHKIIKYIIRNQNNSIKYIILLHKEIYARLHEFEKRIINYFFSSCDDKFIRDYENDIISLIENILTISADNIDSSTKEALIHLAETSTPKIAIALCNANIFTNSFFFSRFQDWQKSCAARDAIALVDAGWFTKEDFEFRYEKWKLTTDMWEAIALCQTNWIKPECFAKQKKKWAQECGILGTIALLVTKIASLGDFSEEKINKMVHYHIID